MFHVTSTIVKCSCRRYNPRYESGWLRIINNNTEAKKKKYIKFRDHQNSAANKIVDTGSPVITGMDGKPISGRGYRPCFNCFLLNVH